MKKTNEGERDRAHFDRRGRMAAFVSREKKDRSRERDAASGIHMYQP